MEVSVLATISPVVLVIPAVLGLSPLQPGPAKARLAEKKRAKAARAISFFMACS